MDDWELDPCPPESPQNRAQESAHARPPRRSFLLVGLIGAGVVLFLVGAAVGFLAARSEADRTRAELEQVQAELALVQGALASAEERNWNYYRQLGALRAELEKIRSPGDAGPDASSSTTVWFGPGKTYGDGIYLVGEDIEPGVYDGVVLGEQGYWARLKGTDGMVSQIIANSIVHGPFVLTIVPSDVAVELQGVVLTAR